MENYTHCILSVLLPETKHCSVTAWIQITKIQKTNLWLHVIEDTEHASLVRTRWYVTKVVCPLDFVVPESVRELKSDLREVLRLYYSSKYLTEY